MRAYKRENPLGRLPEGVSKSGGDGFSVSPCYALSDGPSRAQPSSREPRDSREDGEATRARERMTGRNMGFESRSVKVGVRFTSCSRSG